MKITSIQPLLILILAAFLAGSPAMAGGNDVAGLFAAADKGDAVKIKQVLVAGTDVNATDPDGWTALMIAASAGKQAAVQALLKAGADVNAKSKQGETPLMAGALSGNAVIVKLLLAEGADKTAASAQGLTAADVAVRAKHSEVAKLLQPAQTTTAVTMPSPAVTAKKIEARVDAAATAFQAGSYVDAAKLFQEVVILAPRHALAWHFLGQSLAKNGDTTGARAAYKSSLEIQPSGDLAQRNQALLSKLLAVGRVNGRPVPKAAYLAFLDAQIKTGGTVDEQMRAAAKQELINRELLAAEGVRLGLGTLPDPNKIVTSLDGESYLKQEAGLIRAYLDEFIRKNPISDESVEKEYVKISAALGGTEYSVRHILTRNESEAKAVIDALHSGERFEDLAKRSLDLGSKDKGGDLGWNSPSSFVPSFSNAMVRLGKGRYSDVPVSTDFGYHVILLNDVRPTQIPTLDSVKPKIIQKLQQTLIAQHVAGLLGKAAIDWQ